MLLPPLPLLLSLCTPQALAQDAIRLEVVAKGIQGGPPPTLVVLPLVDLADLSVSVACGGSAARRQGSAEAGVKVPLALDAALGAHRCTGTLDLRLSDGSTADMPLDFGVEVLPPLTAQVVPDSLDLASGAVEIQSSRPLKGATLILWGENGALGEQSGIDGTGGGARLYWQPPADEILRIEIMAVDQDGFGARLELFPWSYSVPHEDVVFETGQSTVRAGEEPKLEAAWAQVQDIVARYGALAPVNLYVAGFTDTVGSTASNQRLSEERARAIARWFQARGFQGRIHYQGFGEQGLAVPTPDEVDEERNRRADYIVAAEAPPRSDTLPGSAWKPL